MKLRYTAVVYLIVVPIVSAQMWVVGGYDFGWRPLVEPGLVAVVWWLAWVVA